MTSEHIKLKNAIQTLLQAHANSAHAHDVLAPFVAYKSLLIQHLYEDLGFKNRVQMGKFMQQNFPTLAAQKPQTVLWKKFLYDKINATAPACATCTNSTNCFSCMSA